MNIQNTSSMTFARTSWNLYRKDAMLDDMVAAIIVTILLVPQSLAYALMAGLPPVVGVMASLLPILAYAAFGSSSTLAVGPVAVLAMMTASVVIPVAQTHGIDLHLAAMVLAIEMAVVFIVAAFLRLDVFAALLSAPVLHGFITGASVVIALGQLPSLLGINVKGSTLAELAQSMFQAQSIWPHWSTAVFGVTGLLLLWSSRRYGAVFFKAVGVSHRASQLMARMAPMLAVVLACAAVVWLPQASEGVSLAGRVDLRDGLNFVAVWHAPVAVWIDLIGPALLLGLVAYVESLAVAEALAARRGEKIIPRRELLGLGAANAVAGLSGGMPVTGGFARSIVNFDAGARTRFAGVWTAVLLTIVVGLLGELLGLLPKAILAATIIVAVLSLIDAAPFVAAWRYARTEAILMMAVACMTVVWGVEPALLFGVVVSAALLLQRTARPHWAEVGRLPGTEIFRNINRFSVETLPGVLAIRIDESLLFTNTRWFSKTLSQACLQRPGLKHVVLMMSGVNDIDFTGLEGLQQLANELTTQGVKLHLSELKGPLADRLNAVGLRSWLTGQIFHTQEQAHIFLSESMPNPQ